MRSMALLALVGSGAAVATTTVDKGLIVETKPPLLTKPPLTIVPKPTIGPIVDPAQRIVCPVIGMFVKSGLLVPDKSGFITRQQTLDAFLARGIPEEIAVRTTNGNFKSADCPVCPEKINPFKMNVLKTGDVLPSPVNGPQEHFRSTGIRDTDNGVPRKDLLEIGEACLGADQLWTQQAVECLANVFDRDPGCGGITSNDVSSDKRPAGCGVCEGFETNPACRSALHGSIEDLFVAFRDHTTGAITADNFRRMWLDLQFPVERTPDLTRDPQRIVCPVIGMFVKKGLLVPDRSGFITRQQTLDAFLADGMPKEISIRTTNGNFKSADCPACPEKINPFLMNPIRSGDVVPSPEDNPQEHFRSTGIRDTHDGVPRKDLLYRGSAWCLPSNQLWTRKAVECLAGVFDRDPGCGGITSNDVSSDKRPAGCGVCEGTATNPACRSALHNSLDDLFVAFANPRTGTITASDFVGMWLELEFPPHWTGPRGPPPTPPGKPGAGPPVGPPSKPGPPTRSDASGAP